MKKKFESKSDDNRIEDIDIDELLMYHAANAIMDEELAIYNSLDESREQTAFPEELEKSIYASIDNAEKNNRKQNLRKRINTIGKVVATLFLAVGIFTFGLYNTSEAFRLQILEMFFIPHEKYDEVYIPEDNNDTIEYNANESFVLRPQYMPDNYKLTQEDSYGMMYKDQYNDDNFIAIRYISPSYSIQVDNERLAVERIYFNGCVIELRHEDSYYLAFWTDKGKCFSLEANDTDRDTFMKIFDGLTWLEDK